MFLDADLILNFTAIEKLISSFEEDSVLSVQPYHYMENFYEKFSMFFNTVSIAAVGVCFPGKNKSIGLFGPLIMVDKELYFNFGGHKLVKNDIIEDYQLGQLLKLKGIKRNLFLGVNDISYRMYSSGISDLIWGWSKNFSSGALKTPFFNLLSVFLWLSAYYSISINLIKSSILFFTNNSSLLIVFFYFIVYLFASLLLYLKIKNLGNFSLIDCFFHIIYLFTFTFIFIFSLFLKFVIKKVRWKNKWIKI